MLRKISPNSSVGRAAVSYSAGRGFESFFGLKAGVAQLVGSLPCKQDNAGSSPVPGSKNKAQPLTDNGERYPAGLVLLCETVLGLRSKALLSQDSPYPSGGGLPAPAIPNRSIA